MKVYDSVRGLNDFLVNFQDFLGNVAFVREYAAFVSREYHWPRCAL